MHGPKHTNTGICLTGDGRTLYSAGLYKGIHAWDMETGKKLREYQMCPCPVRRTWHLRPMVPPWLWQIEIVVLLDTRTGRKLQEFTGHEPMAVFFVQAARS